MYKNSNEEPESSNVQNMIKHGSKGYSKQKDQQYTKFDQRHPFGGEVIETSKEGQSESNQGVDRDSTPLSGMDGKRSREKKQRRKRKDEDGAAAGNYSDPGSPNENKRYHQ